MFSNTCIDECPEGYTNTLSDPTICTKCLSSCLACKDYTYKCTSCNSGYKVSSSNTCISNITPSCPSGYTLTSASTSDCYPCENPCITCSGSTTYCLSCISPLLPSSGECVTCTSPCKTCSILPTLCDSCESADKCDRCQSGYELEDGKCKTDCRASR